MININLAPLQKMLHFFRPPAAKERDSSLLRAELLSIEQLKRHAIKLAKQHQIDPSIRPDKLLARLADNERVISSAYQIITTSSGNNNETNQKISPAENWLLDNYYLIQQQFTLARRHLPRGYSRQLPKIIDGVTDGYPRIYELALNLISHMDGRIDNDNASQFIAAYQSVEPLMLGELWAFPIMLQLALLENLRRISVRIANRREEQETAIIWADKMLVVAENEPKQLIQLLAKFANADIPLTAPFVEEFYARLQDQGAAMAFVQTWVEQQLLLQNITATRLLELASRTAAANQISIANSVGSLRVIAAIDWRNFVEEFSAVEQILKQDPAREYEYQDFATRDQYRHAIEDIACLSVPKKLKQQVESTSNHCAQHEIKAAQTAIDLARAASNQLDKQQCQAHVGYYLIDKGVYLIKTTLNCHGSMLFKFKRLCQPFRLALYASAILIIAAMLTVVVCLLLKPLNLSDWFNWLFGLKQ